MGNAVGGKIKMVIGEDADILKLILEATQLASDTINVWVRISVILIAVSIGVILLGILMVAHII